MQARFKAGGVDATALAYGSPAAVIIHVSGGVPEQADSLAKNICRRIAPLKDAADVQIAQRLVGVQGKTTAVEINHVDLSRTVDILVNHATGGDARRLADAVEKSLRDLAIPEGVRIKVETPARRAR